MADPSVAERRPRQQDSLFTQISDMVHFFWWILLDFLSVMRTEPTSVYGAHLWTISREFRGSMILYLSFLGTALLHGMASFWCIIGSIVYFYMFKMWDVSLFLVGLLITRYQYHSVFANLSSRSRSLLSTLALVVGIYLTSLPTDYEGRTGFAGSQFSMVSGVALILQSLIHQRKAQWFLSLRPISLLGEISFSLYIIHEPLLRLVGWRLVEALTRAVGGSLTTGLILSWVIFTPPLLVLAALYWHFIDKPSVRFSKWLQHTLVAEEKSKVCSVREGEVEHV
ncbi:hypothetical protein PT974_01711 [Cladobotryum mycophilum]|uniref:Acyltransferase 3 domain-containing protein n=1 Tax=Cladobotryum mycophilum TaxID=491253 RepID=A0ABR0SWV6_9HYPO